MRHTLKNKITKEIIIINDSQLQLVNTFFKKKILFENDWAIEEVGEVADITEPDYT